MTEKVYWGVALLMALGIIYVGAASYRPLLTAFHVLVSVLLVLVVLLQSGRAADLAGAFGGAGSQTAFGPRGAATFLSKATTFLAVVFMATSLALAMVSGSARSQSLAEGAAKPSSEQTQPATPGPAQESSPEPPASPQE